MREKRNYLAEIKELGFADDFREFCFRNDKKQDANHLPHLSINRLARAYVLHLESIVRNVHLWKDCDISWLD